MKGLNSVKMRGYLAYPKLTLTANGKPRFNAKIAIPIEYNSGGKQVEGRAYHNICAWGATAEALGDMLAETPIEIDGHLNSRSYDSPCTNCSTTTKKYWTEVLVDNFAILNE